MAINTAQKRKTALNLSSPWRGLVLPSGSISQNIRQGIVWMYSGILAGMPIIVTVVSRVSGDAEILYGILSRESRVGHHPRRKRIIYER